jgi:hypothetical protein
MPLPDHGAGVTGWTDMSDYLAHFSKEGGGKSGYDRMLGILSRGVIEAVNPFGIARKDAPAIESQKCVCLSEAPLYELGRLADSYSEYGIVFRKQFAHSKDANPILYAYKGRPLEKAIRQLMKAAGGDASDPIWDVTPFVDAPGQYGPGKTYYWEYEREWRKRGDLKFTPEDVAFLIIPESLHLKAQAFFYQVKEENLGPSYDCPFIDAHWPIEKVLPLITPTVSG